MIVIQRLSLTQDTREIGYNELVDNEHSVIKNTFLSQIGYFSAKINPVITKAIDCNDHPRDSKIVAVVDRWSLFRGSFVI